MATTTASEAAKRRDCLKRFSSSDSGRRLRREDFYRTKHDSAFSRWEILIGPSDWENYSLGKDGSERYRIHNLPLSCSCPGIYELGVAPSVNSKGHDLRNLDPGRIIVVYLGQADNVRTRLQQYGRAGSHLENGNFAAISVGNNVSFEGSGLFKEIFARGFSIVFRWAAMKNKKEAENTEALLLGIFDYAWNRRSNGTCRRNDVLGKLHSKIPSSNLLDNLKRRLEFFKTQTLNRKRVGIRIEAGEPVATIEKTVKLPSSQIHSNDSSICGVVTANGIVCEEKPVSGRKRCAKHKGMRVKSHVVSSTTIRGCSLIEESDGKKTSICGVIFEDGSICMEKPPKGRKRCEMHKGRRIIKPK